MTVTDRQHSREELRKQFGEPLVLNLGCGQDDYGIGVDIHYNPDIEWDLNDGIPVESDAVDEIVAEHVLEHLDDPTKFFDECYRALRAGGTLRLEIPNVAWLPVRLWLSQDLQRFWSHKDPEREGHWLARRLGNTDDRRTAHRTLWTKHLLAEYLDRHGFEYDIDGWHGSRNIRATARVPTGGDTSPGRTLHELERQSGSDMASHDYWAQTRARILLDWVTEQRPERILDAGCGSGYLTAVLAERTRASVTGIDISEESIQVARSRESPAAFQVANVTEIGSWSETYDAIIFADVLEHFETPADVLDEARSALSPDGSIYVSLPAHEWLWGPHDEHNDHHARYDAESLSVVASDASLVVERSRYTNAVPLVPYLLFQRVLKRPVPDSARGGHNRLVEAVKSGLLGLETRLSPPVGVTLIAELRQR